MRALRWDIFCRVIDNFGDIGVCWRLACALAQRGQQVRLWADDLSALCWMAPEGGRDQGVELWLWQPEQAMPSDAMPGDVVIEAFGCEMDHSWIAADLVASYTDSIRASGQKHPKNPVWINLEYLSAEGYAARNHGLPSPVLAGPARGMQKWFFYPGFTPGTGGLMRPQLDSAPLPRAVGNQRISLFCYEPPALQDMLRQLGAMPSPTELLVFAGRSQRAVQALFDVQIGSHPLWNVRNMLLIQEQPYLPQWQYDAVLCGCDLNFVRGEDSLVQALWAGRAFVWQIYPQADGAHEAKLEAFLDWLQAPEDLRQFHRTWNGLQDSALPLIRIEEWALCAQAARARLLEQPDLVSQLLDFVEEKNKTSAEPSA
jgi:uncharacterized repeat protein (TIGR03837 family)